MLRRLLLMLLLLLPVPAAAQPTVASTFLEGSWALRVDGAIIMRFDLELAGDGWTGAWIKPTFFATDGQRYGNIKMPSTERRADSGRAIGDWAEITFDDPRPEEEDDLFRFRLIGPDRAEMLYVGTGLPPFILERVTPNTAIGPFVEGRVYGRAAGPVVVGARPPTTALPPPTTALPPPTTALPPLTPRPAPAAPSTTAPAAPPVQGPADDRPPAMIGR
jgi:hypothetical protein